MTIGITENVLRYLLEFDSIGITTTTLSSATATNLPQELFFSVYQWAKKNLKMTKPVIRSVRADKFPEIFHLLEQDRIILAPETASEFLRNQVLEKWITNNQINECFEILMNNDVPSMRLYYIVGIPGETEKDRKDFVQLVELASKYVNNIQVVMFPLLMQAGTPFEQFGSIGLDTFNDYYNDFCTWIDPINKSGKTILIDPAPQLVHLIQGIASAGDRHIGDVLYAGFRAGNKLENYIDACEGAGISYKRSFSPGYSGIKPWSMIRMGNEKMLEARKKKLSRIIKQRGE